MITSLAKKILEIDIEKKTFQLKKRDDLSHIIGGVGLSMKLYQEFRGKKPLIMAVGPLNGFFPFCSKTSIFFGVKNNVYDYYLGGSLSHRIKFAGLDAIVILGKARSDIFIDIQDDEVTFLDYGVDFHSQGLPGRRSIIEFKTNKYLLDNYFRFSGSEADSFLNYKNILGIVISGTNNFHVKDKKAYDELYKEILTRYEYLSVKKDTFPSCSGCPVGCKNSQIGENTGNFLVHSIVGCQYAKKLYSNKDLLISCLNVLGYPYTHEDIEKYLDTLYNLHNEFIFK
jgi:aldehyde:ferredoxin oxidoreductase